MAMGTSSYSNGIPSNNSYTQWCYTNKMKRNWLVLNDMYYFYSYNPIINYFFDKKGPNKIKDFQGRPTAT